MRILLTGATGFLGFRTLEHLVGFKYVKSIIATGRKLDKKREIVNAKVKYILGDLTNEMFVHELTYNVDVIINTAALSSTLSTCFELLSQEIRIQLKIV